MVDKPDTSDSTLSSTDRLHETDPYGMLAPEENREQTGVSSQNSRDLHLGCTRELGRVQAQRDALRAAARRVIDSWDDHEGSFEEVDLAVDELKALLAWGGRK